MVGDGQEPGESERGKELACGDTLIFPPELLTTTREPLFILRDRKARSLSILMDLARK